MKEKYKNLKFGIYSRKACKSEESQNEINLDTINLSKYVIENGGQVISNYSDDGYSGMNFDRPGIQKLFNDLDSGKINAVIVSQVSKLTRNLDLYKKFVKKYVVKKNIELICLS